MAPKQARIQSRPLPADSLLAKGCGAADYTDCYTVDVPRAVSLSDYIAAFYNSTAFQPERWVLHLIGKGSTGEHVRALAAGEVQNFAAWSVEARTKNAILMRDFQQRTCSWLCVEELPSDAPTITGLITGKTRLYFGSGVRKPEGVTVSALMPFHQFYAKALLKSAAKALSAT